VAANTISKKTKARPKDKPDPRKRIFKRMHVRIEGDAPLVLHRWDPKRLPGCMGC
jgi:hypothetical protein